MRDLGRYNTYIGARYVPLIVGDWDTTKQTAYEPLTVVTYQGNSYTSRTFVPTGIDITNTEYWVVTGNYNAQVDAFRVALDALNDRFDTLPFKSVKDYGAKGDGVTDDTEAFSNAISENDNIYISPGTYMLKEGVSIPANKTIIGTSLSILKQIGGNNQDSFIRLVGNNITLNTLIIDGNVSKNSNTGEHNHGIECGADNIVIKNLTVKNTRGDGVYVGGIVKSNNVLISRVSIDNAWRNGISVINSDFTQIENCLVQNVNGTAPKGGITAEPNDTTQYVYVTVSNCVVQDCGGTGFSAKALNANVRGEFNNCIVKRGSVYTSPGAYTAMSRNNNKVIANFNNCQCEEIQASAFWHEVNGEDAVYANIKGSVKPQGGDIIRIKSQLSSAPTTPRTKIDAMIDLLPGNLISYHFGSEGKSNVILNFILKNVPKITIRPSEGSVLKTTTLSDLS